MNESLDDQLKRLGDTVFRVEQKITFEETRSQEIKQALNELATREHKLTHQLEYVTHPGTSNRTSTAAEAATELSGVRGGLAELERYQRETQSRIDDLRIELKRRQDDLSRH